MSPEEKLALSQQVLTAIYGPQRAGSSKTALHQLIATILSHRTDYASEKRAFDTLWSRYGSWEAIRDAPLADVIEAIAPARFPEVKGPYIQESLRQIIAERGDASVDFLKELSPEEALLWLKRLPGVGPKTASLVLLFNFRMPVLPVDTHVHRVSQRLGIIPAKTSAERAHVLLLEMLPKDPDVLFSFHKHFFWHGQRICTFLAPRCEACVLQSFCAYYHSRYSL
ncbi:endonuclease III domain-containing protein [Cesiribacter andamanensis]|uniref:Endonuclease III n=1 Tax=Cesiribacter andamanensis AMV16 TaxID=1279009 RepID=M7NPV2_9BACT|nr:endonuclease III [Cesiribacter andamanensis]EMR03740.1 Endonuclease III [Cesiribacter andamanensis AMV16]